MKPRSQKELDMFYLPSDGTCWNEQEMTEYMHWMEDFSAQLEYLSWLDTINELHKEDR